MDVVLLANDLMVVSRVDGAAARIGARVHSVTNGKSAFDRCQTASARLLIVDLSMPALDLNFVQQMKLEDGCMTQIVAFGPHVHADRLAAARHAGCDQVLSRGQFFSEVDTIVQNTEP